MAKYKVFMSGELEDEVFDTEEEAEESFFLKILYFNYKIDNSTDIRLLFFRLNMKIFAGGEQI